MLQWWKCSHLGSDGCLRTYATKDLIQMFEVIFSQIGIVANYEVKLLEPRNQEMRCPGS
jgi:hypothetical protein